MDIGVIRRDGTRVAAFLVADKNAEQTKVRAIVNRGRETQSFRFPLMQEFYMETYRESLRGQEESVLVMGERNIELLESTGIGVNCMIIETGYPPDEVMDVSDLELGVYVARKVHPWASGDGVWDEYDSGIDADLELLTSENLKETLKHFDMDWGGLLNEVDGQTRDDEESFSFDVTGIHTPEELNGRLQVFFGKDGKQDVTMRRI
jgi:hypothetical protein